MLLLTNSNLNERERNIKQIKKEVTLNNLLKYFLNYLDRYYLAIELKTLAESHIKKSSSK